MRSSEQSPELKLNHLELRLGIIEQAVQIVYFLVSFNSGHAVLLPIEKTPPPCEGWG
jgi:hypothetical protein